MSLYHRKKSSSKEGKDHADECDAEGNGPKEERDAEYEERLEKLQEIFPQRSQQELQEVGGDVVGPPLVVVLPL